MKSIVLIVSLILSFAGVASAQQEVVVVDTVSSHPCDGSNIPFITPTPGLTVGVKSVSPVVKNGSLVLVFLCLDGRIIVREFIEREAVPQPPVPPVFPTPPVNPCGHIPGFVESVHGACVPPNHPHAKQ